jgi:hypothetical protein
MCYIDGQKNKYSELGSTDGRQRNSLKACVASSNTESDEECLVFE